MFDHRYLALVAALASEADWVAIPEWPPEKGWEDVLCNKLATVSEESSLCSCGTDEEAHQKDALVASLKPDFITTSTDASVSLECHFCDAFCMCLYGLGTYAVLHTVGMKVSVSRMKLKLNLDVHVIIWKAKKDANLTVSIFL